MKKYKVISSEDITEFNKLLQWAIDDLWVPYGNLVVSVASSSATEGRGFKNVQVTNVTIYSQMMIKQEQGYVHVRA